MPATTEHKAEIVKAHARAANDTGSTEVQVALLTDRINAAVLNADADHTAAAAC